MHILLAMLCIGALAAPHPRLQNTPPKGADSDFSGESTAQQAAKTALEIIASHFDAVVDATPPPASAGNLAPYAHVAGGVLMTPAAGNPTTCGRAQAMNVGTENVLESQLGFVDVIDNVPLKASGLPFDYLLIKDWVPNGVITLKLCRGTEQNPCAGDGNQFDATIVDMDEYGSSKCAMGPNDEKITGLLM